MFFLCFQWLKNIIRERIEENREEGGKLLENIGVLACNKTGKRDIERKRKRERERDRETERERERGRQRQKSKEKVGLNEWLYEWVCLCIRV